MGGCQPVLCARSCVLKVIRVNNDVMYDDVSMRRIGGTFMNAFVMVERCMLSDLCAFRLFTGTLQSAMLASDS